jgi:hypothetical protein
LGLTVLVGVAFCVLFTAFFTMQSLLTSVVGADGFLAIVILYIGMLVGSFLSPAIVSVLGPRLAMLISAFSYTFMNVGAAVTAMDVENIWVLFLSSACCGFGAGSLWCGQGMYQQAVSAPSNIGYRFGVFTGLFSINGIIGFLLVIIVVEVIDASDELILWILVGVSTAAALMFCSIQPANEADVWCKCSCLRRRAAAAATDHSAIATRDNSDDRGGPAKADAGAIVVTASSDDTEDPATSVGTSSAPESPPAESPSQPSTATVIVSTFRLCSNGNAVMIAFSMYSAGYAAGLYWGSVAAAVTSCFGGALTLTAVMFMVQAVVAVGMNFALGRLSDE